MNQTTTILVLGLIVFSGLLFMNINSIDEGDLTGKWFFNIFSNTNYDYDIVDDFVQYPQTEDYYANINPYEDYYVANLSDLTIEPEYCCVLDKCKECCDGIECMYDYESYPIIFIHGLGFQGIQNPLYVSYSVDPFNKIINSFKEEGFLYAGAITPTYDYDLSDKFSESGLPILIKGSYYTGLFDNKGKLIGRTETSESIKTYAQRLEEVIRVVKIKTNRDKVIIIAHCMGGLVAREYLNQFGSQDLDKLIMIGTPNKGIFDEVAKNCYLSGEIECEEMLPDSYLLNNLNNEQTLYSDLYDTKMYTIRGTGCITSGYDGDGVVRSESVILEGAKNYEVRGECEYYFDLGIIPTQFHSSLLDPDLHPETLEIIKTILKDEEYYS